MNIQEAKEQIKNAMKAYFTKDDLGNYVVPIERQRPVFLVGAPGIGKTAIMEQIAQELNVSLLSYSMTHHTRQSALGLPFISHKVYDGVEYDISEYTMSEIIASVYDMIETTGKKEGILFLDEINCVSETLTPIMLQFLQYKIFGRHRVPKGWIVVTAGNPPEYNNSVKEFDIVTLDRLKKIEVEPQFDCWKEYAYKVGVHPSVMTFLEIKKQYFYVVESTVEGKSFVTARGWDDLSQMIKLYEKNGLKVDENLVKQYLQNKKIAKEFATYYDLFLKYRSDYQVDKIIDGKVSGEIKDRAKSAGIDERLSLLGLLLDAVTQEMKTVVCQGDLIGDLMKDLKDFRVIAAGRSNPMSAMDSVITTETRLLENGKKAGSMSNDEQYKKQKLLLILEDIKKNIGSEKDSTTAYKISKNVFDDMNGKLKKQAEEAGKKLSNVFKFCEECFQEGQELLIFITDLTAGHFCALFISKYGCEEYFKYTDRLLLGKRQKDIKSIIEELTLDD